MGRYARPRCCIDNSKTQDSYLKGEPYADADAVVGVRSWKTLVTRAKAFSNIIGKQLPV